MQILPVLVRNTTRSGVRVYVDIRLLIMPRRLKSNATNNNVAYQHTSRVTYNDFFSGCPNQEIGRAFLFKVHNIGTSSYFGVDSATKKTLVSYTLRSNPIDKHTTYQHTSRVSYTLGSIFSNGGINRIKIGRFSYFESFE
jgi:hypothetical protein